MWQYFFELKLVKRAMARIQDANNSLKTMFVVFA
jgi:hypothetical protein